MSMYDIFIDKFQIGLDIFTALSVIFAALHYVRSSKKEAEKQRIESEQQAEKLRSQRLVESGARVLTNELSILSSEFTHLAEEQDGIAKKLDFFIHNSEEDTEQQFIQKSQKVIQDTSLLENLNKEFDEFREAYSTSIDLLCQRRYVFLPVLNSLSKQEGTENIIKAITDSIDKSITKYNEISRGSNSLWKELSDLWKHIKDLPEGSISDLPEGSISDLPEGSISDLPEGSISDLPETIRKPLISICIDKDYQALLSNDLLTEDEYKKLCLEKEIEFSKPKYYNHNCYYLLYILQNDKSRAFLLHNVAINARTQIAIATTLYKEVITVLSACYSHILQQDKTGSLNDVITEYKALYGLGETIR